MITLMHSIQPTHSLHLTDVEKRHCKCIVNFVLFQCVAVVIIGVTIINCTWNPNLLHFDAYRLASIMYLYDKGVCELSKPQIKAAMNLKLSTDTKGFNVLPIHFLSGDVKVSSRISFKTRNYMKIAMVLQVAWAILTVMFRCVIASDRSSIIVNVTVNLYFYIFVFITIFDLSMAIVYVTHIKKALTKGMIVRHSGWSVELTFYNYDEFTGYLPMIAAACWMRCVIILLLNIYSIKKINDIRFRIKKKLVMKHMNNMNEACFPDPIDDQNLHKNTLYYTAGEMKPYVRKR